MPVELPQTLEAAIAQAREATQAAIADGCSRLKVELLFPELKPMPVAEQFLPLFAELGPQLKVFFADAGAAALARREWGEAPFEIRGVNEKLEPIQPEDRAFLLVATTAVEIAQVEKMAQQAGERPFVLLNPQLEDVAIVGIGYAGRQLRQRFLNTIESAYYLRPLEGGAILRSYPSLWQVWEEKQEGAYELIAETEQRPTPEDLEQIFAQTSETVTRKPGLLSELQRFLRALTQ